MMPATPRFFMGYALRGIFSAVFTVTFLASAAMAFSFTSGKVDKEQLAELVATTENLYFLDVRSPGEYNTGHVEGAVNIPVKMLESRITEIPQDRPIVIYCQSGGRAKKAYDFLTDKKVQADYLVGKTGIYYTKEPLGSTGIKK